MTVDRPTFHESWHRVRDLRLRVRVGVHVSRHHARGQRWYLLEDSAGQEYFRISDSAWRLVGLFDGRRTLHEAWSLCADQLDDGAPTQGETVALLGQLWSANLITGDLPPDTQAMLRRRRTRRSRELRGHLSSFLSLRIPLADPDALLNGLAGPLGWLFSPFGFIAWLALVAFGLTQLAGRTESLRSGLGVVLEPANLPWLYVVFAGSKLIHEMAHGLSCKVLARREHQRGEVHAIGLMLLVLLPMPYVDATSAWGLRSKRRRVIVSAAGMMGELALASVAAWIWAHAAEGSLVHALAYNTIFVAGISTVLFNANPLLRYDGYFIMSDLLEIPNLQQRSRDHLFSVVKRYAWGLRRAATRPPSPPQSRAEGAILLVYAVLSSAYRIFISIAIALFVSGKLFFVGVLMALAVLLLWIATPIVRFIHYLAISPELDRDRPRALAVTLTTALILTALVGLVPAPRSIRLPALVESASAVVVRADTPGFIDSILPTGTPVEPAAVLVRSSSPPAQADAQILAARLDAARARRRAAAATDAALAAIESANVRALDTQSIRARYEIDQLTVVAPVRGVWLTDASTVIPGQFVPRGTQLGHVIDPGQLVVRARATQDIAATLLSEPLVHVAVRTGARGDAPMSATLTKVIEVGRREENTNTSSEQSPPRRLFEVIIHPAAIEVESSARQLSPGQRVLVRITLPPEPLSRRWMRGFLRTLQRRFGT